MKRIFLILTEFPPKFGGMQTHALNISKLLSQKYDIIVYTYKPTKLADKEKTFDQTMNFPIKRVLSRISFFYNIKILSKDANKYKPDIIYSSTIFYGMLKEYTDIPVICRSVGNDMLRPWIIYPFKLGFKLANNKLFENLFTKLKKKLTKPPLIDIFFINQRKKITQKAAKNADLILSNSYFTQNIFKKHNIQNSIVLSGGVDTKHYERPENFNKNKIRLRLCISPDCFLIITSGRFVKKKGIDFLIDSFMMLEKQYKNIEFIIIGDGQMKKQLENQASASKKIFFTGSKSQDEIREYYWVADLYVLGSRIVTNTKTKFKDIETMGRVLCEANAASVPVIASNSGGINSIIKHNYNGLLYETDNYNSFSKCFELIYRNKELAQKFVENGLKKAKTEFDWSILAQKHINFFEQYTNNNS